MDDESAYQAQVKGGKGEVDRMNVHIERLRREMESNETTSVKEKQMIDQLEGKIAEMSRELEQIEGGHHHHGNNLPSGSTYRGLSKQSSLTH